MQNSAELQGRRLLITRSSHTTAHTQHIIRTLKELRSLSDKTLMSCLMMMCCVCGGVTRPRAAPRRTLKITFEIEMKKWKIT